MERIGKLSPDQSLRFMKVLTLVILIGFLACAVTPIKDPPVEINDGVIYVDKNGSIWEFNAWEELLQHVQEHQNDPIEIDYGDH